MFRISKSIVFIFLFLAGSLTYQISSAGENIWTSNGPYGASVKTIAINPADHLKLFIGTIHNGIYKSFDAGEHWVHVDADSMEKVQRQIAFHPFGPDTIYATTVRGIFKSIDGGVNWHNISPPGRERSEFRAIVLDPIHPNIIITGGINDRWKSTDSGENWQAFSIDPDRPGGIDHEIDGLAINPLEPNILYLITADAEYGKGIYKSTDEGETWFNTHNNSDSSGFGTDIAVDPVNPNNIYYARYDYLRVSGGRFLSKSTNAGASWFDISPPVQSDWGAFAICILPHDHNTIFIGTANDGVFKSTDGGQNWMAVNSGLQTYRCASLEIDSIDGAIYLGTYLGGIYKSTDGGLNWRKISYNILAEPCSDMTFSMQIPPIVYVTAASECCRQILGDSLWEYVDTGISPRYNVSDIAADKYLPQYLYLTSAWFPTYETDTLGFYLSTDSGQSWDFRSNGLPPDGIYESITISYISASEKRIFVAHNNSMLSGIYYSDDDGQSWNYCSNGLPEPEQAQIHNVVAAQNAVNIIAASDYFNNFFISTDRGNDWSQTNFPSPGGSNGFINDIVFDPNDSLHIYVCGDGYGIFETTDLGNSWVEITNNLPFDPDYPAVSGLAINPINPLNMFVTSLGYGVYQSHDSGLHWEPFNAGLDSTFSPGEIYFVPGDTTRLYLATAGRSVWSIHRTLDGISDDSPAIPNKLSISSYPNPFNAQTIIKYNLPTASKLNIEIFDVAGRKIQTLFSGYQIAGEHAITWNAENIASGVYFYRINSGKYQSIGKCVLLR